MREEWQQPDVPGQTPTNLRAYGETDDEHRLTPVERAILITALHDEIAAHPAVLTQIEHARVTCRDFTNWGFFIELEVPEDAPSVPSLGRGFGHATVGWLNRDSILSAVCFATSGRLDCLECFPIIGIHEKDGGWPTDECRRLLAAPLDQVWMHT